MTAEPQLNEPAPPPSSPPPLPPGRPAPVPLLLGDEWEAGQPNRRRIAVVAAFIGMALIVTCVVLFRSWEPNDERLWVPAPPAPGPFAMPPDSGLRTERVAGTLRRDDLSEPNEVLESPPARPRPRRQIVARPNRPTGYLSINSSPWAELSVDGHVVGSTPQVRIRVTPGRHHLLLVREGFQTHSAWVSVPAGGTVRLTDITLAVTR